MANEVDKAMQDNPSVFSWGIQEEEELRRVRAAVYFEGYYAACVKGACARNEIEIVMRAARKAKLYQISDALREIANRLDSAVCYPVPHLNRSDYPDISGEFQINHCGGSPSMEMTLSGANNDPS